jgi:tetratricopeptide (TPR) repeat protein
MSRERRFGLRGSGPVDGRQRTSCEQWELAHPVKLCLMVLLSLSSVLILENLALAQDSHSAQERAGLHAQEKELMTQFGQSYKQGRLDEATTRLEELLKIRQRLFPVQVYPEGHPAILQVLESLAKMQMERGNSAAARNHIEQALAMSRRLDPAGHEELVEILDSLGNLLENEGDPIRARHYFEEGLAISRRLYPAGHKLTAKILNNLGQVLRTEGQPVEARQYLEQAVVMCRTVLPGDHRETAIVMSNLGGVLKDQGEYSKARDQLERGLEMKRRLYPPDRFPLGHPDLAFSHSGLGALYEDMREYPKARGHLQDALRIFRALDPGDATGTATTLNDLGLLCSLEGNIRAARVYHEQALEMDRRLYPPAKFPKGHRALATGLNNLGAVLMRQGEYASARRSFEQSIDMFNRLYPNGDSDLGKAMNNLGNLFEVQADYERARPYLERALEMGKRLYGVEHYPDGHPDLASSFFNLGNLFDSLEQYDNAARYYEQALAMMRKLFPRGHDDLAKVQNNLGYMYLKQGSYDRARDRFEQASTILRELYPTELYPQGHHDLAAVLLNLGVLYQSQGDYGQACEYARRAQVMNQALVADFATTASEAESLNFAASFPLSRDLLLATSVHMPAMNDATYESIWQTKAAVMRILQGRETLMRVAAADPKTEDLIGQLEEARRKLSLLLLDSRRDLADLERLRREAARRKEALEEQLAQRLPEAQRQRLLRGSSHATLSAALSKGTVFIDLVHYARFDRGPAMKPTIGKRLAPTYTAFVLAAGRPVIRVELADGRDVEAGNSIDRALGRWLAAIKDGRDGGATGAQAQLLRQLIWDKIAPHIPPDTQTIYIAPDWALAQLPWAALPVAEGGPMLLERYSVAVVPHGPFLLERLSAPASKADGNVGLLLAVGGVDYDHEPVPPAGRKRGEAAARRPAETGGRQTWTNLGRSEDELEKLTSMARPREVLRRRGSDAGAKQLLQDLPKARWAALATHAYFADDKVDSLRSIDRRAFLPGIKGERATPGARNPLVLSGLALAGANLPPARDDDGVPIDDGLVTAEAIAGLSLGSLDLVVLSACQTGLGQIAAGEGVFGLQRAFHMAGARDVVAALWNVRDDATAALMGLFHHLLWREQRPPLEALRLAQLYVYRHPDEIANLALPWGEEFDEAVRKAATVAQEESARGAGRAGERSPVSWWAGFQLSGTR